MSICALFGQSNTATVTGLITDPAGAVMPSAKVTIRNVDTNIPREMASDENGDYTITSLPPGKYELTVSSPGFRTAVQRNLVLQIAQVLRVDVRMEVGTVAETVEVSAQAPLLNTEVGAIKGDVIVQAEIQELPLDGRDFTDLAFLVPGVVPMAQGGQGSGMNVNGARSDNTNYSVDGFNNRNPRGAAAQVRPNMDAMQEFKMEVSGFSAENGRMAGGVINMALRSGTNQLHGTLFHYIRNDIFDARAFFDPGKQPLRRNQYGGTLHGPVNLPGLYKGRDRTFFLFSWEAYKEILGQSNIGRVPTALERQGDFTQSTDFLGRPLYLRDPLASGTCGASNQGACFPGNVIPASRFHPIAVRLIEHYPLPNRPDPRNNLILTAKDDDRWDSFMGKVDHRLDGNDTMAVRYQKRYARNSAPFGGSGLGGFGNKIKDDRSLLGIDNTHMFSPAFLLEIRGGYSRNATRERTIWEGQDIAGQLGIPGTTTDPELVGFPRFTMLDHYPLGSANAQPVQYHVTTIQGGFKFTWIKSRHALKWGFDAERVRFNQPFFDNMRGTFNFQDRWTNHTVGDFLLGMMQSATRTVGVARNYMRSTSYGMFFNDDFKATRSLTLNLGLRYELDMPPVDRYDRASNFLPELGKIVIASGRNLPALEERVAGAGLQDRVTTGDQVGLPRSLVYADKVNFAPRVGFAWRAFGSQKTVVRGGWGIFYGGHLLNPVRTALMTGFPFSARQTFNRLASNPGLVTLSNPFPDARETESGVTNSNGYELRPTLGYIQSFNLTVEREIFDGTAVEVAYVGSRGFHLGRQYDINQPLRSMERYMANQPFLRPVTGLNAINYFGFGSNSFYNAGQISLRRRSNRGWFYRLNYSYSKSVDDASQLTGNSTGGFSGAQNARDLRSERGRSDFDRRHVVTGAFSYQLPFGRGKRWMNQVGRIGNGIIGGWQLSGTGTFYTGQPFTVNSVDVDANLGESLRPNRLANGTQADIAGAGRRGVDYPWFNLLAFEKVPRCTSRESCLPSPNGFLPFAFGNSGRNILDGPAIHFVNLAMLKNFRMERRRNFQLRYELFNILNHANFNLPNRSFNSISGGVITSVQDRGRGGPRVMQLALKYEF